MELKATYDYPVLLKRERNEKIGAILIPETSQRSSLSGKVVAVHPECMLEVGVGDIVYFSENEGVPISVNDEELWAMKEGHILAKST